MNFIEWLIFLPILVRIYLLPVLYEVREFTLAVFVTHLRNKKIFRISLYDRTPFFQWVVRKKEIQ